METIARSIANTIVKRGVRPQSKYDRCFYGAHAFLTNAFTTLVMLVIAILLRVVPEFLVYTAAYWGIHSVAEAYHCDRYYKCLLLSAGLFMAMALFCLFTNEFTRHVFSLMLFIVAAGVTTFQVLDAETQKAFTKKSLTLYIVFIVIALILNFTPLIMVSFPFTYGTCVITILQAKVRKEK